MVFIDQSKPSKKKMTIELREFMRERRKKHEYTTSRQVLDFMIDKEYITIPLDHEGKSVKKEFDAAACDIQQLVNKLGCKRDKKNGIVASHDRIAKRDYYLKEFVANIALPPQQHLQEVYLDKVFSATTSFLCFHSYLWLSFSLMFSRAIRKTILSQ